MNDLVVLKRPGVNWRQVLAYLALTFGLTWLLDLVLWRTVGYGQNAATGILLQLQMLLPALCAILLGMFVFKENPLYQVRTRRERPRWFFYYFVLYTAVYLVIGALTLTSTSPTMLIVASGIAQGVTLLGLLLLIVLRFASGRAAYARAGLAGGKILHWVLFALGFILFYVAQTALNYALGLGQPVDIAQFMAQFPAEQLGSLTPSSFLLITAVQAVLLSPFVALLLGFGEEYGWRGYLQSELVRLGRARGILLLGIIWGIWHAPVILMGHNYPGYPVAGVFLMTLYTIGLGFALGYAVLKSGSVLLAAFLHALNNQVVSFLSVLVYKPNHPIFSFGVGLYGIATLALVVLLILRDPLWREP